MKIIPQELHTTTGCHDCCSYCMAAAWSKATVQCSGKHLDRMPWKEKLGNAGFT
eukprot:CAMPEP_0172655716 /NCGR_PEP_ID=MMETSP1074-20121228/876_1 /TAXON_ID=2916 /ORGANISM="Ceratium fusus, Strain PA161109" /LENGTH=53 /DNA_ID=CAMNT_0013470425 /DNA_START=45 /DNA_END=206 /DNA_ORIENTATION=+